MIGLTEKEADELTKKLSNKKEDYMNEPYIFYHEDGEWDDKFMMFIDTYPSDVEELLSEFKEECNNEVDDIRRETGIDSPFWDFYNADGFSIFLTNKKIKHSFVCTRSAFEF